MLACDVTDDASVARLAGDVLADAGRLDLLVNNAGIGAIGGAEETSVAQAQALFDVNVFGLMRMTRAVLPAMRQQGRGRIINISSILGLIPSPYSAVYAASKHAVEGYAESLDHELRSFGIRVVLVEPAYTSRGDAPAIVAETVLKAARAAEPKRRYPAGRLAGRVQLLRRFVPESAFDKSLRRQVGLPA